MATIAELLLEKARQESDAQRTQGALANQTWQHLADIVSGTGRQIQQERIEAPIRAQEAQMRGLQIQNAQTDIASKKRAADEDQQFRDLLHGETSPTPQQLLSVNPERGAHIAEAMSALARDPIKEQDNIQTYLQKVTLGIDRLPEDMKAGAYEDFYQHAVGMKLFPPDAAPAKYDPAKFQQMVHYAQALPKAEPYTLKPGEQRFNLDNKVVASVPENAGKPSAEQDDQRYRNIQAQLNQHQVVPSSELAWAKGYEKQKTLGVDLTAGMAAQRQLKEQAFSNQQTEKKENFTEAEAGRAALTKNVNTPYSNSRDAVDSLRDVIRGAEQGNKVDAALISMEAAFAVVRKFGLNRVNTTELGVTGNAGDFMDSIMARLGKVSKGDPVPDTIKDDMKKLANSLERQAFTKYSRDFDTTAKLYGLSGDTKQDDPWEGRAGTIKGKPVVWTTKNGVAGWYPK